MNHCLSKHGSVNFFELPRTLALIVLLAFLAPVDAIAHCDGKHIGNHPHCRVVEPPPPTECPDEFPGFSYMVEATRKAPEEIWLSSTDGCRRELVAVQSDHGRGMGSFHMTTDRSNGILLWKEDPGAVWQWVVHRQDFTVDAQGDLILVLPVQLLPQAGEDVQLGDELYYFNLDIWGDDVHDAFYLAAQRSHSFGPEHVDGTNEILIYNLNDMNEVREIYLSAQLSGEWSCPPDVPYPQFVAGCYGMEGFRFNPSGTRLYISARMDDKQGQRWDGELRIHIDRVDAATGGVADLADWTFSAPELVFTGTDGTGGNLARPGNDPSQLPFPEQIAVSKFNDTGSILDADICAAKYAEYANGTKDASPGLWRDWCVVSSTFYSPNGHGGGDSWQSPDAILTSTYSRRRYDIFRRNSDGTEELLIEKARGADTGL
jgi:hypothetical protein